MATEMKAGDPLARSFALIALGVFLFSEIVTSILHATTRTTWILGRFPVVAIAVTILFWAAPFAIVYLVERRDWRSLGLSVLRRKRVAYSLYTFAGLVLPGLIFGVDADLGLEFLEQVLWIGLAEEIFNRGYVMRRLCDWIGNGKGLLVSAFLFGLSHVISRVSQHGFSRPSADLQLGAQTLAGGLLLGFLYLRSKSIVPPAIVHISMNLYLGKAVAAVQDLIAHL
jgi:membrane protease YdiL (CAAX protease family)